VTEGSLEAINVGIDRDEGVLFEGVNLAARSREVLVITGESGSGKSVLAAVLAGVIAADHGEVRFDGTPLPPPGADAPRPAYAPEDGAHVSTLTAAETVGLPLQASRVPRDEVHERVGRWLGAVGLANCADRLVSDLSGGQRQRVSIARALALSAPAIVLDEPTSELDADNRAIVIALLKQERDRGGAIVVVSNDPVLVEAADATFALGAPVIEVTNR